MPGKKKTYTADLDELLAALPDTTMGSYSSSMSSPITITSPTVSTVNWTGNNPYTISNLSGATYTVGNAGNAGWASPLSVNGNVEIKGNNADISINGVRLGDRLSAIETQLNILQPNPEIESEWDELAQLGERYRQLEQEIKEKMEVWRLLQAKSDSIKS
jgi:hypothetical protein